eukprot:CAMPEP_0175128016 /NCGR_PEP_ID=MMETSP0087-20121206/4702_1 /TAXON_ID=136419 /ORGANISM="Unknown Unknown, Strain D1" /LENGTH=732 /DNA_ID=CAMNT_0016410047 /DNA_START=51 /DNA_END=2246 /DNA_ORIENTATION=+
MGSILQWLKECDKDMDLSEYAPFFTEQGFQDFGQLQELKEEELKEIRDAVISSGKERTPPIILAKKIKFSRKCQVQEVRSFQFQSPSNETKQRPPNQSLLDGPQNNRSSWNLTTYKLVKELGGGFFSRVYLGIDQKTNQRVALKILEEVKFEDTIREVALMWNCRDNPNVVSVYTILSATMQNGQFGTEFQVQDPDRVWRQPAEWTDSDSRHIVVMEYCEGQSLTDFINSLDSPLPEAELTDIIRQLCRGLYFLHHKAASHQIAHTDIKPDNILLVKHCGRLQVKLADLGVAVVMDRTRNADQDLRGESEFIPTWCEYSRAESLKTESEEVINTFTLADVYAVAMCAVRLASRYWDEEGDPNPDLLKQHLDKIEQQYSKEFRSRLQECLQSNELSQPSVEHMYQLFSTNTSEPIFLGWDTEEVRERLQPLPFDAASLGPSGRLDFQEGSRQWLFDAYNKWLTQEPKSRLFWVTGVAGTGKTAFALELLRRRRYDFGGEFFFQHNTDVKSSLLRMVTTVAYQLAQRGCSDGKELQDGLKRLGNKDLSEFRQLGELLEHLVGNPLRRLPKFGSDKAVILLDALDEASSFKEQGVSELLAEQLETLPPWVCFVLTSRPETQIMNDFASFHPFRIDTQSSENQEDLKTYLSHQLEQLTLAPGTGFGDALGELVSKCDGLFLYATKILQAHDRAKPLSLDAIRGFPDGLHSFYREQLLRCQREKSEVRGEEKRREEK